jgi:cobalt-zinc-cadmium efflux system membrane fusion protein
VVPRSAIVELEQGASVFVLHEDGFEPSAVKLGLSDDEHVQILDGLQPGQVYVSTNAFALKAQLQKGAFGDGHAH